MLFLTFPDVEVCALWVTLEFSKAGMLDRHLFYNVFWLLKRGAAQFVESLKADARTRWGDPPFHGGLTPLALRCDALFC